MTKPHTTLSEAVRALALPTPTILDTAALTSWEAEVFARGALAMRKAAAALVDSYKNLVEEQEKWYAVDFAEVPMPGHWVALWPVKQQQGYVDGYRACQKKEQERQEPEFCGRPGTGECSCRKFMDDPTNCERRLEEVATLAATQAGDAKDAARYRWFKDNYLKYGNSDPDIRRPIILFEGRWYGGHFDNMNDLDVAIDAAMSPTTTRSE